MFVVADTVRVMLTLRNVTTANRSSLVPIVRNFVLVCDIKLLFLFHILLLTCTYCMCFSGAYYIIFFIYMRITCNHIVVVGETGAGSNTGWL